MNIVFDLDGTLVDSAPDLRAAVNKMLEGEGLEPLSLASVISFVGNGLPRLVERAMAARGIAPEEHARLCPLVQGFYNAAPADHTRVFPGVIEALGALKAVGHKLGICTNKPEAPARAVLRLLGLADYFDVVIGGDTLPVKKPDPAPLSHAFDALGEGARVYVGDSEVDAETAVATGVRFLLYTEGYRKTPVESLPHDAAFDHFDALAGLVGG